MVRYLALVDVVEQLGTGSSMVDSLALAQMYDYTHQENCLKRKTVEYIISSVLVYAR